MTPYMKQRQSWLTTGKPPKETKVYRIRKVSKKRQALNKEYSAVSKPKWEGERCAIGSEVCTGWAQGWNHPDGKENAEKLLDVENGQPACNPCNCYIEIHHKWAVENGFRGKRNKQTKRYINTYKKQ